MKRTMHLVDVFGEAPLQGNPLAVVSEAEDLEPERMLESCCRGSQLPQRNHLRQEGNLWLLEANLIAPTVRMLDLD